MSGSDFEGKMHLSRYPARMITTVSIPIFGYSANSRRHSVAPQFWLGMSCVISSRNVPVMRIRRESTGSELRLR